MSDVVIQVENLSKRYRLGQREPYLALRDVLANALRLPFRGRRAAPSDAALQASSHIWALDDVSFNVTQGEIIGIIGRNGSGKTTLLRILSRITRPTKGFAAVRGRVGSLLEVGTGFHPELTGRENLYMSGSILGMKKHEIDRKFDEVVAFAEVEPFLDTPVKRYSTGMQIRLAFAVAAHLEPEVLLIDEVLSVGDAVFQKKCLGKMGDAMRQGRTVLFVSHNMGVVKNLCQRCLLLKHGKVALSGEPGVVITEYLQEGLGQQDSTRTFPENPATPLSVRKVSVTDEHGRPTRYFHLGSTIVVEIDYVVRRTLRQSMVLFAISRDGVFIFQSHDTDLHPRYLDQREAGAYRARVSVPRHFLTAGHYTVSVSAAIGPHGEYGHDGHPEALNFLISEDDEDVAFKSYSRMRGSLVIAELQWHTTRAPSAPSRSVGWEPL